ncbi:hypothetical protein GCM10010478_47660 [Streptomyces erythrogriseus]|uniref:Uncharacterized protein n=1 Tax=Streptomyces erythrogriseus TaxID=284027 RepID=A0ABN3X6P6_9ACTN
MTLLGRAAEAGRFRVPVAQATRVIHTDSETTSVVELACPSNRERLTVQSAPYAACGIKITGL